MSTILPFIVQLISLVLTPQEVSLVFAGDAMQHQGQLDAARRPDGSYGYDGCFDAVAPYISAADYAVVNLETTLGAGGFTGYPCFCSPDSYAEALRDAGFDMMLTANNHTLDRLDKGLHRTISVLDSLGVDHLGTYHDGESRQRALPMVKDIKGIKIGFLNYTYGTNGLTVKGDAVVDYIDTDLMASDIESARAAGAEILAVAVHWGVEYKLLPHPSQKALADFLVGQGVDLIIGCVAPRRRWGRPFRQSVLQSCIYSAACWRCVRLQTVSCHVGWHPRIVARPLPCIHLFGRANIHPPQHICSPRYSRNTLTSHWMLSDINSQGRLPASLTFLHIVLNVRFVVCLFQIFII